MGGAGEEKGFLGGCREINVGWIMYGRQMRVITRSLERLVNVTSFCSRRYLHSHPERNESANINSRIRDICKGPGWTLRSNPVDKTHLRCKTEKRSRKPYQMHL